MDPLRLAAALVSPYATWTPEAPDEAALLGVLNAHGAPPQSDLFEPWEPDGPWLARVLWPDLADPAALLAHGPLEDGHPPGLTEWMDRGRVGSDVLFAEGTEAHCLSDLERGGLLVPDLVHLETERADIVAIARRMLLACGATTDRDQVTLVLHRSTGRPGLLVELAVPEVDPFAERQAALDALAAVVREASGPVRLAPVLRWWYDFQRLSFVVWIVAPVAPVLPREALGRRALPDGEGPLELQVRLPPESHDADALALSETLGAVGLSGGRPRWSHANGERVFLATWVGRPDAPVEIPFPHRWVPGCPEALEGERPGLDPEHWAHGVRVVTRWHCGLRDRDLLPICTPRTGDAIDRALAAELAHLGEAEPVSAGRAALRLRFPAVGPEDWGAVVEALCSVGGAEVAPDLVVAMRGDFVVLLFRADLSGDGDVRWTAS